MSSSAVLTRCSACLRNGSSVSAPGNSALPSRVTHLRSSALVTPQNVKLTMKGMVGRRGGSSRRGFVTASSNEDDVITTEARQACQQAIKDEKIRMMLEIILPLIGATDLDDWPGGIEMQFKAGAPLVSTLLRGLLDTASAQKKDGGCRTYIIDDSDAVGGWESDEIAAVLFPTPETLDAVEALASVPHRPLLLVNAQWQPGQIVSDFGFGARKKAREDLVNTFEVVYFLKRSRILGEDVCLMRRYPGDWQVFVIDEAGGTNECVGVESERPSYRRLEEILKSRKGSKAGQGWFDRLVGEFKFNQKSLKNDDN
nr:uncharacterized protein LOC112291477 isoform X2 [Physcomitrium patens]|eukprot:XP_024394691.1 uncharacterized protein LOC112291477 isoform X2 [Physcomitrella patens]